MATAATAYTETLIRDTERWTLALRLAGCVPALVNLSPGSPRWCEARERARALLREESDAGRDP